MNEYAVCLHIMPFSLLRTPPFSLWAKGTESAPLQWECIDATLTSARARSLVLFEAYVCMCTPFDGSCFCLRSVLSRRMDVYGDIKKLYLHLFVSFFCKADTHLGPLKSTDFFLKKKSKVGINFV